MNLEVCSTEYLRDLFRELEKENWYLKSLLDKAEIPYAYNEHFDIDPTETAEYDVDQSNRIVEYVLNRETANKVFSTSTYFLNISIA